MRRRSTADQRQIVEKVVAAAGDRIKVAGDILAFADFFQADDQLAYDEPSFDKHVRHADAAALLAKFRDRLAATEPFDAPTLEKAMQDFVAAEGIKIGQIIHPVRVAVTGKSVGLGLFDTLAILGRERFCGGSSGRWRESDRRLQRSWGVVQFCYGKQVPDYRPLE